jgi:hypothetical protein
VGVRCFPAVGGEEEVDGVVFYFLVALEVGVDRLSDCRRSVWLCVRRNSFRIRELTRKPEGEDLVSERLCVLRQFRALRRLAGFVESFYNYEYAAL